MSTRVHIRRLTIYLVVAAILAVIALAVSGLTNRTSVGGAGTSITTTEAAPENPEADCDRIEGSLRPAGPLPTPGVMPTGTTMEEILQRGRLIVGVNQGNYLLSFRDPGTGELQGAEIDIARSVAEAIFGDPNRVQFIGVAVADRVEAAEDRRVDMVISSFSVTCERQRSIDFSTPYLRVSQRLLVRQGSGISEVDDLAGRPVCTSAGSTTEQALVDLPLDLQVVTQPILSDCLVELLSGRVVAVSSDDVILAGMAAQDPLSEVVGRSLDETNYAIGISNQTTDFVRFVNAVLERERQDGALSQSFARWFSPYLTPVPQPAAADYRD